MIGKTSSQNYSGKSAVLPRFGDLGVHTDYSIALESLYPKIGEEFYFGARNYLPDSKRYLDWKALDRAARLIATASVAPVRRRKGQAAAHAPKMLEDDGGVADTSAAPPVRSRDFSSSAAVGSVDDTTVSMSEREITSAAKHEEGAGVGERSHGPHRVVAGRQVSTMTAQRDVAKGRSPVWAEGHDPHAAISTKVAPAQVKRTDRSGPTLDLADFAALGGVSYMDTISVTGIDQATTLARAVALSSPPWVSNTSVGSTINVARGTDEGHESALAGPYSGTGRAFNVGHMPAYTAPNWMRVEPWLAKAPGVGQAEDGLDWLKPTQAQPAAPHNAPADVEARRGRTPPIQQGHGVPLSSSPETRAADVWAGSAQGTEQTFPSDDVISAGFDAVGDTRQQVLDEMTRLASRPPAGVTGFNAGQMPAWLSGWTGGV